MARFEGKFEAAGEARIDVDELFSAVRKAGFRGKGERKDAIACFLSASEGWEQARAALKGAFAAAEKPTWLRGGKE